MNTNFLAHRIFPAIILWTLSVNFIACSKKRDEGGAAAVDAASSKSAIQHTSGIVTGRELLTVLSESLSIDFSSNSQLVIDLLGDYLNFSSSLPKFGDHGTGFSSVMSRLITNFVAQACTISANKDASITQMSNRVVFRFIDIKQSLTTPTNADPERWSAFTKHLAYRFWGTAADSDELKVINDFATGIKPLASGTAAAQTQDAAVLICTLVGSSPRAFFKREY